MQEDCVQQQALLQGEGPVAASLAVKQMATLLEQVRARGAEEGNLLPVVDLLTWQCGGEETAEDGTDVFVVLPPVERLEEEAQVFVRWLSVPNTARALGPRRPEATLPSRNSQISVMKSM